MGGIKKKSPNSNHARRTTSHKMKHHWEKMGSRGGNLGCREGGRHLRKRSLLNGNQMGCVLLNGIPDLQRWAGAGLGCSPLGPFLCRGDREAAGGGWGVAGSEAVTEWLPDPRLLAPGQCSSHPATLSASPLPGSPN